ncbi:MAG: nitroreductase family protein [Spirochaetales bacterium]|nr:nitroreductase family protein [Spirochaetales bacterium]
MDYMETIRSRYSCKRYCDRQISKEQLDAILEAGRVAPTAKNTQEHRVYVVQSAEGIAKVDSVTPCRYGAPTVLVVTYDKTQAFVYPGNVYNSGAEDATIVATQMILAARAVGVDSCWVNRFNPDEVSKALDLPENEVVVMIMDLGFAADGFEPLPNHFNRKPLEETVRYI